MPREALPAAYGLLLAVQTAMATFLFEAIFPYFQQMIARSGQPQDPDTWTEIAVIAAAVVMQGCYWVRYRWVPPWVPLHSPLVGHLVMFASRTSFFFGGALFSTIFFRHVPQLEALPPLWQGIAKACGIMAILFALFCYSLDLDRLGRAIEEPPAIEPGVDRG